MDETVVAAVSAQLPDYTDQQVADVLNALDTLQQDPPIGTVLQNPDTLDVAVRVAEYGVPFWRVVSTSNVLWIEKDALVGWVKISDPVDGGGADKGPK